MRELEEEKRQRRNFEKASLVLLFLSLVLLAVVAAVLCVSGLYPLSGIRSRRGPSLMVQRLKGWPAV